MFINRFSRQLIIAGGRTVSIVASKIALHLSPALNIRKTLHFPEGQRRRTGHLLKKREEIGIILKSAQANVSAFENIGINAVYKFGIHITSSYQKH